MKQSTCKTRTFAESLKWSHWVRTCQHSGTICNRLRPQRRIRSPISLFFVSPPWCRSTRLPSQKRTHSASHFMLTAMVHCGFAYYGDVAPNPPTLLHKSYCARAPAQPIRSVRMNPTLPTWASEVGAIQALRRRVGAKSAPELRRQIALQGRVHDRL